jgi:hypothetical protein
MDEVAVGCGNRLQYGKPCDLTFVAYDKLTEQPVKSWRKLPSYPASPWILMPNGRIES